MEIFRFSNHIRLRHPDFDPAVISEALGMNASTQWRRGDPRRGPEGAGGKTYQHTYWSSEPRRGEDAEILDVLDTDLTYLEARASFLHHFEESGGWTYYISWFASDRSGDDTIAFSQLGRLAALHIDLSLDVYSVKPDQPTPAATDQSVRNSP